MGDDEGSKIQGGRLARLAKMASLTARTSVDLARGKANRTFGDKDDFSAEKAAAHKMLETLGTMKGAAMKLGQQLAMEADNLPPEARDIVAKLFAQAQPMSYADVAKVIEEELGEPPEGAFKSFDKEPAASASLGQVHRAVVADGTPVAVKIQYPGVAEALVNDLKNAGLMAGAFRGVGRAAFDFDTAPYVEEIRREIGAETDYLREAGLNEKYRAAVAHLPEIHVPRVYPAYSTSRVLTMEWVEGVRLRDFAASDADEEARWRVGRQLALALLAPFVAHRMIHGDPHPGNFLVRPDGRLTVLDFGAVKFFSEGFVRGFWGLMEAEVDNREPEFLKLMTQTGYRFRVDDATATRILKTLHDIAAGPVRAEIYDWGTSNILNEFRLSMADDMRNVMGIQPPPESMLFYRAIGGLAQNLKAMRTKGPYRQVCVELTQMFRAAHPAVP